MAVVVKIEGVTIDANKLAEKSVTIKRTYEKGRSLSLSLYYTAAEGIPAEGQDIEVLEDSTTLFGGIIKTVKPIPITPAQGNTAHLKVQLSSDGYNDIPQRRTVNTYYTDTDAGTIVTEMITNFLSEEGVTAGTIGTGATIDTYNGIYQSINEVLDDMADASGFTWNIDDSKALNFESQETPNTTTKTLTSDDSDHFNFRPTRSLSRFRNKQYVEGGTDSAGNTVRVVVENPASIAARAAAENNSGVYGKVYRDNTIQTETDALTVATELLNRYVKPAAATFSSYALNTEFDEGDLIEVTYAKYSIAASTEYLVTSKQLKRDAHRWVYTYTIEARDSIDYSGRTKGNAIDFFSKLAKGTTLTGTSESGSSGITYDIVDSADLPIALGTTTASREFNHNFPDVVDLLTTLTFQYTATAAVQLTLAYKDGATTDYTFTLDLPAGTNTKTFNIPEYSHVSGEHTFAIDLTADADSVLQLDQYLLSSRWEKYVDSYTPAPAPSAYGEYELLADIEVTSATTSVDITGLSLTSDDEILLVSDIINPNASNTNYYLYVNGLTSTYYNQKLTADSTSESAARVSTAIMSYCEASDDTLCIANINRTESGYFTYQAHNTREYGISGIALDEYYGTKTATISSITQLTVTASVTDGIGTGSRFWLYRKGEA